MFLGKKSFWPRLKYLRIFVSLTKKPGIFTFDTSIKLGLAIEIKPKVWIEQFTSWESISQAASADSVLLSTYTNNFKFLFPEGELSEIYWNYNYVTEFNCKIVCILSSYKQISISSLYKRSQTKSEKWNWWQSKLLSAPDFQILYNDLNFSNTIQMKETEV